MFEHLREKGKSRPNGTKKKNQEMAKKEQTSPRKFTHFIKRDAKKRTEALEYFNDKMANLRSNRQIY